MTTWVSCYSDNGKPRFKRCNLQAKWLCDTLLYLLILDVRINIGDYTKWQYLGQHPWRWVLIGTCLFEMVDEILFCMVQFIFYKTYRAMNLDGFEKLLASVCLSLFRISHLARASAQHLCFLPWCLFLSSILKIHLFHRSSAALQGQRCVFSICNSCRGQYRSLPQEWFGYSPTC